MMNSSETLDSHPRLSLPRCPSSWYFFGPASSFKQNSPHPASLSFNGQTLIGFRDSNGGLVVMNSRCSHLGSDLKHGSVENGEAVCGFHGWRYGASGGCSCINGCQSIPDWARQNVYPAVERFGYVFFFYGKEPNPLFEFPEFPGLNYQQLQPSAPFFWELDCPWYMIGANAFDSQHFSHTHDRRSIDKPQYTDGNPFLKLASYRLEIIPDNCFQDRILSAFFGKEVNIRIDCWSGNIVLVTSIIGSSLTLGMGVISPLSPKTCRYNGIVFAKRSGRGPIVDQMNALIKRSFVRRFLAQDKHSIAYTFLSLDKLLPNLDDGLRDYFLWLSSLKTLSE